MFDLGRRVRNCCWEPKPVTFCCLQGLRISTTADKYLVALPSVKEHCIFTKCTLSSTLATITYHHFPSSLLIITFHHDTPPSVKEHSIFKNARTASQDYLPHSHTISDAAIHLYWSDNSPIFPSI